MYLKFYSPHNQNQQYKSSNMMLYFYYYLCHTNTSSYLKIGFVTDILVHLLSFLLVIQVTYSLKFILFKLLSAKEVVKMMLDHMTNPQTSTHLGLKKGKNAISLLSLTKIQILLNRKLHGFNVNSMLI